MRNNQEMPNNNIEGEPVLRQTVAEEVSEKHDSDPIIEEIRKTKIDMEATLKSLCELSDSVKKQCEEEEEIEEDSSQEVFASTEDLKSEIETLKTELENEKNKVKDIKEKIRNLDDDNKSFSDIRQKIVHASLLFNEGIKSSKRIEALNAKLAKLTKIFKEQRLGELGIQEGETVTELVFRKHKEKRKAEGIMGIGSLFRRKEISKLNDEAGEAQEISYQFDDNFKTYSHDLLDHSEASRLIENFNRQAQDLIKDIISKAEEKEKILIQEQKNNPRERLSGEHISRLKSLYIKNIIESDLENSKSEFSEEEIEKIREFILRKVSLPEFGSDDSERKKIRDFEEEFNSLDYRIQKKVHPYKIRDIDEMFQTTAQIIEVSDIQKMNRAIKDLVESFNKNSLEYYKLYFYKISEADFLPIKIKNFSAEAFKLISSDPDPVLYFGEERISEARNYIEKTIVQELYSLIESQEKHDSVNMGYKMIELGGVKNASTIILNSFRDPGHSGECPFISTNEDGVNSLVGEYAKGLSEEDLLQLEQAGIPGLIEIINFLRNGGDPKLIHNKYDIEEGNADQKTKDNYSLLHENLAKMFDYYVKEADPKSYGFLISLSGIINHDLSDDTYKLFNSIMLDSDSGDSLRSLVISTAEHRLGRFDDVESLLFLIESLNVLFNDVGKDQYSIKRVSILNSLISASRKSLGSPDVFINTSIKGIESANKEEKYLSLVLLDSAGGNLSEYQDEVINLFLNEDHYYSNQGIGKFIIETTSSGKLNLSPENMSRICSHVEKYALENAMTDFEGLEVIFKNFYSAGCLDESQYQQVMKTIKITNGSGSSFEALLKEGKVTDENWAIMLSWYAAIDAGRYAPRGEGDKMTSLFSNEHPDHRRICLENIRNDWENFLATGKLNVESQIVSSIGKRYDGIGDLQYIEGVSNMIFYLNDYVSNPKAVSKTSAALFEGLRNQEERFKKERWSDEDRTYFYTVSKDIMAVSPSLYTDYLELFEKLSPKDMKLFANEYFGVYQALMIVLDKGKGKYSGRDLLPIRKQIEMISEKIKQGEDAKTLFDEGRTESLEILKEGFTKRFGLIKTPENFTPEHIKTMQNFIRYAANLNKGKEKKNEAVVGLLMSLALNGKAQAFRSGEEIDLKEYLTPERLANLGNLGDRSPEKAFDASELGINESEIKEFMTILQDESVANMIGNVETVDVKLGNIKRALMDLDDPDAYEHEEDKKLLALYKTHGKSIGAVLAKLFSISKGKGSLDEGEKEIAKTLADIYQVKEWDSKEVKKVQDETRGVGLVHGIIQKIELEDVDEKIADLRKTLMPNDKIISIFKSLGEEFESHSGALALSEDLLYLENIISKNVDKLGDEEKLVLSEYLEAIRGKMKVLEATEDHFKQYFDKLKKSVHGSKKGRLQELLVEMEKIVYSTQKSVNVVSRITGNMSTVIENIRQCLGCLSPQCNNDTNLTFGEPYRFLVLSQNGEQKGSIADQIVMFLKTSTPDGSGGYSFVFDTLYGVKSADVLMAHVNVVNKKLSALKKRFPDIKASILVTSSALSSAGLSEEIFIQRAQKEFSGLKIAPVEEASVNVPKSNLGDNYSESLGGTRPVGDCKARGLILR